MAHLGFVKRRNGNTEEAENSIDCGVGLEALSLKCSETSSCPSQLACFGWLRYSRQSWFGSHHENTPARRFGAYLSNTDIPVHELFLARLYLHPGRKRQSCGS